MKYYGWTHPTKHYDGFGGGPDDPQAIREGMVMIYMVEADCWEEACDAWHKWRHNGRYRPICPNEQCWGSAVRKPDCGLCFGKSSVSMDVWRLYRVEHPEIANCGEGPEVIDEQG